MISPKRNWRNEQVSGTRIFNACDSDSFEAKNKSPVAVNLLVSPFKCDVCLKPFYCSDRLKEHTSIHNVECVHDEQVDDPEPITTSDSSNTETELMQCHLCENHYITKLALKQHLLLDHNIKLQDEISNEQLSVADYLETRLSIPGRKSNKCLVCSQVFYNKTQFRKHFSSHLGPDTVPSTSTSVTKTRTRRKQIQVCHICGRIFDRIGNLKQHLVMHSGKRPYQCPVCHKEYRRNENVKRHLFTHFEEKSFQCYLCSIIFNCETALKKHYLIHTHTSMGEKLYPCVICDKPLIRKSLKVHLLTHNEEKSFECQVCCKKFTTLKYLKRHLREKRCPSSFTVDVKEAERDSTDKDNSEQTN